MSATDTYSNVKTIGTSMNVISGLVYACVQMHQSLKALDDIMPLPLKPLIQKPRVTESKKLISPMEARSRFIHKLKSSNKSAFFQDESQLINQKAAILNTINESDFIVSETEQFSKSLSGFLQSDENSVSVRFEELMVTLENQHQAAFTENLQMVVSSASSKLGFEQVKFGYENDTYVIIAGNGKNQAIRTEIRMEPDSKIIDLKTEILGLCDSKCKNILNDFHIELSRNGITYDERKHKRTRPIPFSNITASAPNKVKNSVIKNHTPYQPTFEALKFNSQRIKQ